jgi:hypothetical protein
MKIVLRLFLLFSMMALSYGWRLASTEEANTKAHVTQKPSAITEQMGTGNSDDARKHDWRTKVLLALKAPSGSSARESLEAVASSLSGREVWALCRMLVDAVPGHERDKALCEALLQAGKEDAFRAWELFSHARFSSPDTFYTQLKEMMVRADPLRAWDVLTKKGTVLDDQTVRGIAADWVRMRSQEAADFGYKLTDAGARKEFLRAVVSHWIARDFSGFQRWFLRQNDQQLLVDCINPYCFSSWSQGDARPVMSLEALDFLAAQEWPMHWGERPMENFLSAAWSEPALKTQAPAWIANLQDPELRDLAWATLAANLPADQQAAALAKISDPEQREKAAIDAIRREAWLDPAVAFRRSLEITDPAERSRTACVALGHWADREPQAALQGLRSVIDQLLPQDLASLGASWRKGEATEDLLRLLSSLPSKSKAEAMVSNLAGEWVELRPEQVSRWLEKAPAGSIRDAVAAAAVKKMSVLDTKEVMALAQSIRDPGSRLISLGKAYERWLAEEPISALDWLQAWKPKLNSAENTALNNLVQRTHHKNPRAASFSSNIWVRGRELKVSQ